MKLYKVYHEYFCTDRIMWKSTKVRACSLEQALAIYNREARKRLKYPYCWNIARISDVSEAEPEEILE